jgi:hypothetical protein
MLVDSTDESICRPRLIEDHDACVNVIYHRKDHESRCRYLDTDERALQQQDSATSAPKPMP